MFSKGRSIQPQVYVEMSANAANLLKYTRMLAWSCLLALVIAALSRKVGWKVFVAGKDLPLLEVTALVFSLLFADNELFFGYFGVIEGMYLCILHIRANERSRREKYHMLLWLALCFFSSYFVVLGQLYLAYLFLQQRKDHNKEMSAIIALLLINLLLMTCTLIIPLNFFAFLQILFTAIFFPITFLILQSSSSRLK